MNSNNPMQAAFNYRKADKLHKDQYQAARAMLTQLFTLARFGGPEVVKPLIPVIEQIEYAMQEACGFEKNNKKHRWWMEVPGCTCPYEDNMDLFGTDMRIYSEDCPYHGHLHKDNKEVEEAYAKRRAELLAEIDEDNEYGF